MSSGKDKNGEYSFECDRCGETEGSQEREFKDAWAEVQSQGWTYRNRQHFCASCSQDTPPSNW